MEKGVAEECSLWQPVSGDMDALGRRLESRQDQHGEALVGHVMGQALRL